MDERETPCIYLVGAGPGDPGLMTVRGAKILSSAEVILHDDLCPATLLETYASKDALIVNVGLEREEKQEKIYALFLKYSKTHKKIVRLKNGDPFIFGRGGEEAAFLKREGILFEIVPGVSSVTAIPASMGIALTDRTYASSFGVFTAQVREGSLPDYKTAALMPTAVFLMGAKKISEVSEELVRHGKDEETPMVVIERGCTADEKRHYGTLKSFKGARITSPALIIVGKAVCG